MSYWLSEGWTRPKYGQLHRHYHKHDHIDRMFSELENWRDKLTDDEFWDLATAIEFHDVIWYPDRSDNEERSIAYAEKAGMIHTYNRGDVIKGLIMATKSPFEPKTDLERLMIWIDWANFLADNHRTHETNMEIFREFQMHPFSVYSVHRNAFFMSAQSVPDKLICERFISPRLALNLKAGIARAAEMSLQYRPRIAIFVGSFNPFHDGHYATVKQAERFYDKVILVQAGNAAKAANGPPEGFPPFLARYYETHRFLNGESMDEILAQITSPDLADYTLVRGIRNGTDLTDEQTKMRIYRDMGVRLPIHHLLSDAEFQHISSSAVRELRKLGHKLYTNIWDYKATDDEF